MKSLLATLLVSLATAPASAQLRNLSPRTPLRATQVVSSSAAPSVVVGLDGRQPWGRPDKVLRSTNGGVTFDDVGVPGLDALYGVGLDATGTIYAFGGQAVHVSVDGGVTWTARATPFAAGDGSRSFVPGEHRGELWVHHTDPNDPSQTEVWRSRDAGRNWFMTARRADFPVIYDVDGADPRVAVARSHAGLLVTRDGGLSWATTPTTPAVGFAQDACVSRGVLFLTVHGQSEIWASHDDGQSWTSVATASRDILMEVDPARPQHIVAVDSAGELFESWDLGTTWARHSDEAQGRRVSSLAIHGTAGTKLCLVSMEGGTVASDPTAGAMRISEMNSGNGGRFFAQELDIDPQDLQHLVAQTLSQFSESFDGGASWLVLPGPSGVSAKVAAFGHTGEFFVGGLDEDLSPTLHRRSSSGWTELGIPSTAPFLEEVNDIVVSPNDPNTIVIALRELVFINFDQIALSRLLVSTDAGANWIPRMVGSPTDPGRLKNLQFVGGTQPPRLVMAAERDPYQSSAVTGARRTDDLGETYVEAFAGTRPFEIAVSRNFERRIISAANFGNSRIRSSFDAFENFTQATSPGVHTDLAVGTDDPLLFARRIANTTAVSTVSLSRNAGATWFQIPELTALTRVYDLIFAPGDGELIVLATADKGILAYELAAPLGTGSCGPAEPNVAGRTGQLRGFGSDSVLENEARLFVSQLPPNVTALLIGSTQLSVTTGAGGSFGTLCLGGSIGRDLGSFGAVSMHGERTYDLDLSHLPGAASPIAAQAGTSWGFQVWYRDQRNGVAGSNFTDALVIQWQP